MPHRICMTIVRCLSVTFGEPQNAMQSVFQLVDQRQVRAVESRSRMTQSRMRISDCQGAPGDCRMNTAKVHFGRKAFAMCAGSSAAKHTPVKPLARRSYSG